MPKYLFPLVVGSFSILGCSATPTPDGKGQSASGGSNVGGTGVVGSGGSGTGGSGVSGTPNANGGSGTAGTAMGGSSPASGGAPSGGAATAGAAGTGGAAPACIPDLTNLVNNKGWVCALNTPVAMQGAFYGYGDMKSCTPASNICSTGSCCITGATLTPDMTFSQWGCGIGLELNSTGGMTPVKQAYTGPVKCFDLTLTGSSGKNVVRIGFTQAATTGTKVSPFVEIPAFTAGWTGQVCFTDAECPDWAVTAGTCTKPVGTAGTPYDMQIQVSAGATTASDFNVCVSKVTPVTTTMGGGTTNSCSAVTGQGTITDRYGTAHVTCNGKDYIVQNNAWGSAAGQTLTYGPGTKMKVTQQSGTGANGAPASYPSIFLGANSGRSTAASGLPKAVSSIAKGGVATSWTWAANGATGSYNASYDVWFSTGAGGDPAASAPTGGYLMVWYHKPPTDQPIGMAVATATIAGRNWSVWYGINTSSQKPCVSYIAQQTVNSLAFSLGDFIRDAVERQYVQDSWYMTNVFAGFEIWSGGTGLETTDFAVTP